MPQCEICVATVVELRRGRCWGCYTRWVDARPVGLNAKCCCCAERRRDLLRSIEVLGAWMPMCFSCAGKAGRLETMPRTLYELRSALHRDRRAQERRGDKADTRVFQHDRRNDDRREGRTTAEGWMIIDEEMILEIEEFALAEQSDKGDGSSSELTKILDLRQ